MTVTIPVTWLEDAFGCPSWIECLDLLHQVDEVSAETQCASHLRVASPLGNR